MKICMQQFLGQNHSWSIVGQNIARALLKLGHGVDLNSTNGYDLFPKDLEPYIKNLNKEYDAQISYTAFRNFPNYLSHGNKNRIGIWNYETTVLPPGFVKFTTNADYICPSSQFAADIFIQNKVPKEKVVVIPHGINVEEYSSTEIYPLKTDKSTKIFANIAQPHIRKNIDGMFEAYGQAFTKKDDVCLVIKITPKQGEKDHPFNVDFWKFWHEFCKKYPKHADVEIITDWVPSMVPLYNACDILFSMTRAECFWLPGLEAMAKKLLVIAPNYGGQLEFMNKNNSLLIPGKVVRAPRAMQYWVSSPYAETFEPSIGEAANLLSKALENKTSLIRQYLPGMTDQVERLTWDNIAKEFIKLCSQ